MFNVENLKSMTVDISLLGSADSLAKSLLRRAVIRWCASGSSNPERCKLSYEDMKKVCSSIHHKWSIHECILKLRDLVVGADAPLHQRTLKSINSDKRRSIEPVFYSKYPLPETAPVGLPPSRVVAAPTSTAVGADGSERKSSGNPTKRISIYNIALLALHVGVSLVV